MTFTTSTLAECSLRSMAVLSGGLQSKSSFTTWYVRSTCVPPTALPHRTHRSCHVLLQVWLAVVDTAAAFNAAGTAVVAEAIADHPFRVAYFPVRERLHNCSVLERPTHGAKLTLEVPYRLHHLHPTHRELHVRLQLSRFDISMARFTVRMTPLMQWRLHWPLSEALAQMGFVARVVFFVPLAICDYFHPYAWTSSAGTTAALRPTAIAAFCLSPLSLLFLWHLHRRRRPRHHIYLTRPLCGTARSS